MGSLDLEDSEFEWVPFYEELAKKLVDYHDKQPFLLQLLDQLRDDGHKVTRLQDTGSDGSSFRMRELDPFTFFGVFNRGIKDDARIKLCEALKEEFSIESPAPQSFSGIPVLNNMSSWFVTWEKDRKVDDIQALWSVFCSAVNDEDAMASPEFAEAFNRALEVEKTNLNLTIGLYWIRPRYFVSLDSRLRQHLKIQMPSDGLSFAAYANIRASVIAQHGSDFPVLSRAAWLETGLTSGDGEAKKPGRAPAFPDNAIVRVLIDNPKRPGSASYERYKRYGGGTGHETTVGEALANGVLRIDLNWDLNHGHISISMPTDLEFQKIPVIEKDDDAELTNQYKLSDALRGTFLPQERVELALKQLRVKKNLILQGAPGVGKSFLARRLAHLLIGTQDAARVATVQFHPSYSYDDFVRGFRPAGGNAQFQLEDGLFLRFAEKAEKDPDHDYVLIIEEINRANLAHVLGELFMLIEYEKRGNGHAISPLYRKTPDETLSVPDNLYIIGTMNITDRSLALLDFAVRRRFTFVTLEPAFGTDAFRDWLLERELSQNLCDLINVRMNALNSLIENDRTLGSAYRLGHSFFCLNGGTYARHDADWYEAIVSTEILPYLDEYWHENPEMLAEARRCLLG